MPVELFMSNLTKTAFKNYTFLIVLLNQFLFFIQKLKYIILQLQFNFKSTYYVC